MKIYSFDAAPNPRRLALFMRHKGIEIDTVQIDMLAGEQLSEDYIRINPHCTVPALVLDDGTLLTEVIGICTYLEALHPEKPLLGEGALEKAQIISWDHKLFNLIMTSVAEMLRNRGKGFINRALPGPLDVPQIAELVERGKLKLDYAWQELDATLDGREWLASDALSLADIDLLVCSEFSNWVKSPPPEECVHLQLYLERVRNALA